MNLITHRVIIHVAGLVVALFTAAVAQAQTDELADVSQMLKLGQYDQALGRVNSYLSSKPKDARARFLKGLILAEQNKPDDAIKVYADLTQDYPELPGPYNNLAVLYAAQGKYDKARGALEQAIRTHPSYATAYENLGDVYAKMASQSYDKVLQLDKSNTTAQSKLNMIRDLFPADTRSVKTARAGKEPVKADAAPAYDPTKVATAVPAEPVARTRDSGEVMSFVNAWAKAWSSNDVPAYLASYAPDFRIPGGAPRAAWEAERRARVAKPRKIQVTLVAPKVEFKDDDHATVTFVQHYNADDSKSVNDKVLEMSRNGDKWLIQLEQGGG